MRTLLVIEDEAPLRDSILRLLEFEGYNAVGAVSGETGLADARRILPDGIICDIMLPGIDGYQVVEALHADPATAGIPVIFMSAMADRAALARAHELGIDDYLVKPVTLDVLLAGLRKLFGDDAAP